ncbi:MAG TPA: hypothetical protein VG329_08645 [Candidatus Dormibacteraeota bacterium]|nr:hypothetical protein [Candidatus Dormibacteraeota bacterium]
MPRRRPPVDIFTFPIPDQWERRQARCPQCGGVGHAIGQVGMRLVFRCSECGVRFKAGGDEAAEAGR